MTEHELLEAGRILALAGRDELLPRFFADTSDSVTRKTSAFDVVTAADVGSEAAITAGLRDAFPGVAIVGEEATEHDASLLNVLDHADRAFVVDPLDGTRNFADGLALFGVMLAYLERGRVVGAAIHDPIRRDTAYALRGEGAWMVRASGVRMALRVATSVPVAQMDAVAGTNFMPEPMRSRVRTNLGKLGMHTWFRCAAHEYRMAASGRTHVLLYNRLMPWDHAAGWLLHREAGGYSAHFDGSEYAPSHRTGGLLCAPDRASWEACRDALFS